MSSQITTKRRGTGLSNTARRPIKALSRVTRSIFHRFKPRRYKSHVDSVSNQGLASHSNFDVSIDKTAVTTYVQPVQQAETCPTLDHKPRDFSISPEIFGSAPIFEDVKARGIDPLLLAIAGATLKLLFPIALLLPQPKVCDFENVLFKTCPQYSEHASQRHRQGSDRRDHKRAKRGQRGESNRGEPDDDGNDGNDGEGNDGGKKPDGLRYPESGDMPKLFDCPFRKSNPRRFNCCNGYERFCDLKLHIMRRHLLGEGKPYCPNCRDEFFRGGRAARDRHMRGNCPERSIQQTGMLLPAEWEEWKSGLEHLGANAPGKRKWKYLWQKISNARLPSPYVELANAEVYRRRAEVSLSTTLSVLMYNLGYSNEQQIQSMSQQILDSIFPSFTTATEEPSEPEQNQQDNDNPQPFIDPGNNFWQIQYSSGGLYYENPNPPVFGYDHPNPQDGSWNGYRQ
ncbi:hypothetical protein CEP54_013381 [Fusarium duplospermum]|uniref:C2H2-type domain-containing protein n=1 Tax=Fusarium duplospermum TaxID=1325734 RepID=A0A428P363_9HYPO|nr:hypothetical protein CEP54_013381 [Fusarium duplospermum]